MISDTNVSDSLVKYSFRLGKYHHHPSTGDILGKIRPGVYPRVDYSHAKLPRSQLQGQGFFFPMSIRTCRFSPASMIHLFR